jgi:hypothetical protein
MSSVEEETILAERVLDAAQRTIENVRIRFGRTHKVDERFIGLSRSIVWLGPCHRRGGGFNFLCDYGNMRNVAHKMVLKQMLSDYGNLISRLKDTGATPLNKRRKKYEQCRNTAINSSNDLEFEINGHFISLATFMPTKVRELRKAETEEWLSKNTTFENLYQLYSTEYGTLLNDENDPFNDQYDTNDVLENNAVHPDFGNLLLTTPVQYREIYVTSAILPNTKPFLENYDISNQQHKRPFTQPPTTQQPYTPITNVNSNIPTTQQYTRTQPYTLISHTNSNIPTTQQYTRTQPYTHISHTNSNIPFFSQTQPYQHTTRPNMTTPPNTQQKTHTEYISTQQTHFTSKKITPLFSTPDMPSLYSFSGRPHDTSSSPMKSSDLSINDDRSMMKTLLAAATAASKALKQKEEILKKEKDADGSTFTLTQAEPEGSSIGGLFIK